MPFVENGPIRIRYEEAGNPSGYPLLLLAPGGMNSGLINWSKLAVFNPLEVFKDDFRIIAMDQRNALNGESVAPVETENAWDVYLGDQLAVMDQLGIRGFFALGFCIGCSFALNLATKAADRLTAAVLCQPIGHRPEDPDVLHESGVTWGKELAEKRSDVDMATVERLLHNLYRAQPDFVYSVTRDDVARCETPLLVLPGNDRPHPHEVGVAVADLARNSERMDPWKTDELVPEAVERIRAFLRKHVPAGVR